LHLFPGQLSGFAHVVVAELTKRMGGDNGTWRAASQGLGGAEVTKDGLVRAWRNVPYSPRQTKFVHDYGRNGRALKSGRDIERTERFEITINVDSYVRGANRAEAAAKWDEALPIVVEQIIAELEPAVCWHCKGKGVVRAKDVPPGATT
jgi:hypothetical protein